MSFFRRGKGGVDQFVHVNVCLSVIMFGGGCHSLPIFCHPCQSLSPLLQGGAQDVDVEAGFAKQHWTSNTICVVLLIGQIAQVLMMT